VLNRSIDSVYPFWQFFIGYLSFLIGKERFIININQMIYSRAFFGVEHAVPVFIFKNKQVYITGPFRRDTSKGRQLLCYSDLKILIKVRLPVTANLCSCKQFGTFKYVI